MEKEVWDGLAWSQLSRVCGGLHFDPRAIGCAEAILGARCPYSCSPPPSAPPTMNSANTALIVFVARSENAAPELRNGRALGNPAR